MQQRFGMIQFGDLTRGVDTEGRFHCEIVSETPVAVWEWQHVEIANRGVGMTQKSWVAIPETSVADLGICVERWGICEVDGEGLPLTRIVASV